VKKIAFALVVASLPVCSMADNSALEGFTNGPSSLCKESSAQPQCIKMAEKMMVAVRAITLAQLECQRNLKSGVGLSEEQKDSCSDFEQIGSYIDGLQNKQ